MFIWTYLLGIVHAATSWNIYYSYLNTLYKEISPYRAVNTFHHAYTKPVCYCCAKHQSLSALRSIQNTSTQCENDIEYLNSKPGGTRSRCFKRLTNQWRPLKTLFEQDQNWMKNVFSPAWTLHCNVPNKDTRACHWLLPLTNCIFEAVRSLTLRPALLKMSYQLIDISPLVSCLQMAGPVVANATYIHFLWVQTTISLSRVVIVSKIPATLLYGGEALIT